VYNALQFGVLTDYFLEMQRRGRPHWLDRFLSTVLLLIAPCLAGFVAGCNERERLTFPDPGDGVGPVTFIDQPNGPDTTVTAGPQLFISGRTIDLDGVDTVYFLVSGANQDFQPFRPSPPTDTVHFGLQIVTSGQSGDTISVGVLGVDSQGNRGAIASRRVFVQ
jgi:hypothetical protein